MTRHFPLLPAVAAVICASAATAQEMTPVTDLPAAALAILSQESAPEFTRGWEADLDDDGDADLLTQAAYAAADDGGNAAILKQMILRRDGADFQPWQEIALPDGIKSARRDGASLVLTLYAYQPEDPQCCPSGESEMTLPLD